MKVLITGGSAGIGLALVKALLSQGDEVWACARTAREKVMPDIQDDQQQYFHYSVCDLTDKAAIDSMVVELGEQGFVPDVVYHNAAVYDYQELLTTRRLREFIDLNMYAIFHLILRLKESMKYRTIQHILVSSIFAKTPDGRNYIYAGTKAGVSASFVSANHYEGFDRERFKVVYLGPIGEGAEGSMVIRPTAKTAEFLADLPGTGRTEVYYPAIFRFVLPVLNALPNSLYRLLMKKFRR